MKDISKKDVNELGSIPGIGQALARKIKEQTGNVKEEKEERFVPTPIDDEEEAVPVSKPKQRNLFDF